MASQNPFGDDVGGTALLGALKTAVARARLTEVSAKTVKVAMLYERQSMHRTYRLAMNFNLCEAKSAVPAESVQVREE